MSQPGRPVPSQPGWVGVMTRIVPDRCAAMFCTVAGPPPPCRSRTGRPVPASVRGMARSGRSLTIRVLGSAMAASSLSSRGMAGRSGVVRARGGGVAAHDLGGVLSSSGWPLAIIWSRSRKYCT